MGRSKTIPLETKLKLIREYKNGDSSTVLAERYSVHQTTVLRIIRDKERFEYWAKQLQHERQANHSSMNKDNHNSLLISPSSNKHRVTTIHHLTEPEITAVKKRKRKLRSSADAPNENHQNGFHHSATTTNTLRSKSSQQIPHPHRSLSMVNDNNSAQIQSSSKNGVASLQNVLSQQTNNKNSYLPNNYHQNNHQQMLHMNHNNYQWKSIKSNHICHNNDSNEMNGEYANSGDRPTNENKGRKNDGGNEELDHEDHRRMMAFRKFFEYIDNIEEIVLAYDPEFKEAFKFTRELNNSSLRYRYLLYELEKQNHDRRQQIRDHKNDNFIRSSTPATKPLDHQRSNKQIDKEFCNLIREGIARIVSASATDSS